MPKYRTTPKCEAYSLTAGESHMHAENPALFIIGGALPYIWFGNDGPQNKGCYATIAGRARLRRIAKSILKIVAATPL